MTYRLTLLLALFCASPAYAQDYQAKVTSVRDGDTLLVMDSAGTKTVIRLAEIDAPEGKQDYGSEARSYLSLLTLGKEVRVTPHDQDSYGRTVATIYLPQSNASVNHAMVRTGWAWAYTSYLRSNEMPPLQEAAKREGAGLWKDDNPLQPWKWRKLQRHR